MSWFDLTPADWQLAFWTIAIGMVCNIACALLGCFLVLRRLSLLGDAISHGVLPGIVLAFLLSGQLTGWPIILGAMVLGVLTTFLTQAVQSSGKVPEDASMGVVFTSLFALGVILIARTASQTHIDVDCVLYGLFDLVATDTIPIGGYEVPRAFPTMALTLAGTLVFVILLWKELKIVTFDPALATAMGIHATLVHYLLMAMVAGVTVTAFEAVGSILVIAMLIVPAACASLLTDRLVWMTLWAALVASLASILGYVAAQVTNTTVAPMMAVAAGFQFLLAVLFAPRHGILARIIRNFRLALRITREDIIATLYRREEVSPKDTSAIGPMVGPGGGGMMGWLARRQLQRRGEVEFSEDRTPALTESGRLLAQSIVRSHRLWEAYLGKNFDLPLDHLHDPATRMEHFISPDLQSELASELSQPDEDPHGRKIPPATEIKK